MFVYKPIRSNYPVRGSFSSNFVAYSSACSDLGVRNLAGTCVVKQDDVATSGEKEVTFYDLLPERVSRARHKVRVAILYFIELKQTSCLITTSVVYI
jgi:hypothetical protein